MVNVEKDSLNHRYRLILAPNCSICWRQLVVFYLLTCLLAALIGLFFWYQGLWLVLPFSGLEMLALGLGLYLTSLGAHRREVITIDSELVRIAKGRFRPDQNWEFKTAWVRLEIENSHSPLTATRIKLGSHGKFVVIGDFLNHGEKDDLAFELKDCIIRT